MLYWFFFFKKKYRTFSRDRLKFRMVESTNNDLMLILNQLVKELEPSIVLSQSTVLVIHKKKNRVRAVNIKDQGMDVLYILLERVIDGNWL